MRSPTTLVLTVLLSLIFTISQKNSFQINLFKELNEDDGNILISPISIYQALALTANGASGETQNQILETLEPHATYIEAINTKSLSVVEAVEIDGAKCTIANAIFSKLKPLESFVEGANHVFHAGVEKLKSKEQINDWVNAKTAGRIETIIDNKLDDSVVMVLVNAIYMKPTWVNEFTASGKKTFNGLNGAVKKDYMQQKLKTGYFEDDFVQAVAVPFDNSNYAYYVIQPKGDIHDYIDELTDINLSTVFIGLKEKTVDLSMPKFEIEYGSELKDKLRHMGIRDAFSADADFSGISGNKRGLQMDQVLHKTYFKVNEQGVEAAGTTAVVMTRGFTPKVIKFEVNRPFIPIIKDTRDDTILFIGKITKL
jgi:serpin B